MAGLFSKYTIKNIEFNNRIVMAPMCMDSAQYDGLVNEWHELHYATRAVGGTGLILLEATAVESRGRITAEDLGIWSDAHTEGHKRLVEAVHRHGSLIGIQLAHAGRKCEVTNESIIGPSALAFDESYQTPAAMTLEEIEQVVDSFRIAAIRANQAGYDAIEIHGAHGYLINQFMSPLTNHRIDAYGGSPENRARFLNEVLRAVSSVWPKEKALILRVTAEEYVEAGNHPEEVATIINLVKHHGIDLVDVSSGGVVRASINTFPGYQIRLAETIKILTGLPVIGGGLITSAQMAEELIQNERVDMVYFGRELLRNPYFPMQAAQVLQAEHEWPVQYMRSKEVKKGGF